MPRPTNFVSVVQKLVREQVEQAIHGLLGSATPKKKAKEKERRLEGVIDRRAERRMEAQAAMAALEAARAAPPAPVQG